MAINHLRKALYGAALLAFAGGYAFVPATHLTAAAQTNISGDIAGTVTDSTGAVVANAQVQVNSPSTGVSKTVTTDNSGNFRVPLLSPGDYALTVTASGFNTETETVTVAAGRINPADFKMSAGGGKTEVVQVTEAAPLLHTQDAQVSTSFTMDQVQNLPNPGNDLTFVAQTAPGAVMNTQGGYGNFSVFGLPATSNTFTVNGGYENDPFLNVNNSGASNLLLGNNDIADVTVISNAYDAAFGGLGGAQINEISRSGSNGFHGNASYWWNGRVMNANDWFHNGADPVVPRPFDNVNQWAVGVGGPIKKDKLFFFGDYEGLRIILPTSNLVGAPSAGYESAVLTQLATSPATAAEIPFYQQLFGIYNNAPGHANQSPSSSDPNAVTFTNTASNFTHEWLATGRVDWNIGPNDHMFVHGEVDKGLQATYTDPLNPLFDADSPQPQYQGQLQETHTFSPAVSNQFLFSTIYYRAIFTNTNLDASKALAPYTTAFIDGVFNLLGGENYVWPQGRNVTGYQFQDDVSWTRGNHTLKLGWTLRRDDITDYSPNVETTPLTIQYENQQLDKHGNPIALGFYNGYNLQYTQAFPQRLTQPVALYNMGAYLQDTWKALPNLTVTAGLRLEHNSNPICVTNCYARLSSDFYSTPTSLDAPYNTVISSGLHRAFPNFQHVAYEPRVGFSWQPFGAGTKTVIRGGFGMFADAFPGQVADDLLNNPPSNVNFTVVGGLFDPTQPGSAAQNAQADDSAFVTGFASGQSFNQISTATGGVFTAPNFTSVGRKTFSPTYDEWSLSFEQQINRSTAVTAQYIGNHGYHEVTQNEGINAFANTATDTFTYGGLPTAPYNPNFLSVNELYNGADSNYNGVVTSLVNRTRWLTLQLNYAYSHSLDEISNGGFDGFGGTSITYQINPTDLQQQYGNSDYDTRHYISGSYVFTVPHYAGPKILVDDWTIAGTVFHNTGYPFSEIDGTTGGTLNRSGYGITANPLAAQLVPRFTQCGSGSNANRYVSNPNYTSSAVPCAFASVAESAPSTAFGQQSRNQLNGPGFTDTDLDIQKGFHIPGWESANLKLGAQFFNLFNHPNFAQPIHNNSSGFNGFVTSTVNTPTSILGSFLGGDASPRLIQLKAVFTF